MIPRFAPGLRAIVVAGCFVTAAPAAAFELEHVATMVSGEGSARTEFDLDVLTGNRFVAAWSVRGAVVGKIPARGRVYDGTGNPLTEPVLCTSDAGDLLTRYPVLATTLGDHIAFGCAIEQRSGLTTATLGSWSDEFEPLGARTTFDDGVSSYFFSMASVEERAFVVGVDVFDDDLGFSDTYHRIDIDGSTLGVLPSRIGGLVPHAPDRFLTLHYRSTGGDEDNVALRRRLVSGTGRRIGKVKRVHRAPWDRWRSVSAVRGIDGRTALLIQNPPAENWFRFSERARVVLIDADSNATAHKLDVELNGFLYLWQGVNAWALPAKSGFVVLWSRQPYWEDFPRVLYGVWLQHFDDEGTAVGEPVELMSDPAVLGRPVLSSDGETYLVPLSRETTTGFAVEVHRLLDR